MVLNMNSFLFTLSAYLLGSIPFGLLVSHLLGLKNPRNAGSGNIGFTNVLRISGTKAGTLTLLGDLGKGLIIGWIANSFFSNSILGLAGILAVVSGHIFPVFLNFKGGKGVATGLGGILGFHFTLGLFLVITWIVTVRIFKYSSAGALSAFTILPIISLLIFQEIEFFLFSLLLSAMVILRHKNNIQRLISGTEPRIMN